MLNKVKNKKTLRHPSQACNKLPIRGAVPMARVEAIDMYEMAFTKGASLNKSFDMTRGISEQEPAPIPEMSCPTRIISQVVEKHVNIFPTKAKNNP